MTKLNLRDYQEGALQSLRDGFAAGHKRQILVAPTGAGKTEIAIALLEAASAKGNRSAMILDRIVLCDQTSRRLEKYGIDHGVLQSGHWRFRPYEKIQVVSAQTMEKRGKLPDLRLLLIDECHSVREKTKDFLHKNPDVFVVGLTATPFTKGLGKIFDRVVSPVTTNRLVADKSLVPLRVFIAKEIDMEGAKKVAGEWSAKEATDRGMKITGDIVQEWIKKTHEIYGKPMKTIVFSSGVDHANDLAKQFAEHGYNFVSISYRDDDQFKRDAIEDFAKPDTEIHGLIATDILTKGFDVADTHIAISARPFSKSLSSHVQQMGRIMRPHPGKEFGVWLDHAGNYLRFQEDWMDVAEHGVSELDDGKEKTKKEKSELEKKESKCPKCGSLWSPRSLVCGHCGYIREPKSKVTSAPGELSELRNAMRTGDRQEFWSMCRYKMSNAGWSEARARMNFKDKFGNWPNHLQNLEMVSSVEFEKFIKSRLIAYLKGKGKK
jgi:superfamily II DNA or RNA helicase